MKTSDKLRRIIEAANDCQVLAINRTPGRHWGVPWSAEIQKGDSVFEVYSEDTMGDCVKYGIEPGFRKSPWGADLFIDAKNPEPR